MAERPDGELGEMRRKVLERYPDADPDTVWRAVLSLDMSPRERVEDVLRFGLFCVRRRGAAMSEDRVRKLKRMSMKLLKQYPDADPDAVWRALVNRNA